MKIHKQKVDELGSRKLYFGFQLVELSELVLFELYIYGKQNVKKLSL